GHPPDHPACIALQVLGGQPRLAEEPKKGRAHHGQEGEYSHDKFAHFFLLPARTGGALHAIHLDSLGLGAPRRGPFFCQPTGSSPFWGVRLSSFDEGTNRNFVASEAANATDCRCPRTSFW